MKPGLRPAWTQGDDPLGEYVPGLGEGVATETEEHVKPPQMYRVLMHNDDYTTMDFVVSILMGVFNKEAEDAVRIMLNVHHKGFGVCGVYTEDIASTKIAIVHARAQSAEYPLRCSMEPD
jgi:ATP-dependent Clp protease adaptor protein ClpS